MLKLTALLLPLLAISSAAFAGPKLPLDKRVECRANEGQVLVVGNAADDGATSTLSIKLKGAADYVAISETIKISDEGMYIGRSNGALDLPKDFAVVIFIDELHVRKDTRTMPVFKLTGLDCELK